MKQEIVYKDLSYDITKLLFEVHNELGRYCNEKQYGDLLEGKLKENNIKYEREKNIPPSFENEKFGRNRIDFIIEDKIILEFKCKRIIDRNDYYQVLRYLKAFTKKLGMIINFREKFLQPKRVLNSKIKDY
jgi:GxxExxY protein